MASSKILTLCDALVTAIDTAWTQGASDTITRRYIAPINLQELNTLTGRHVYVFPGAYSNSPLTRGHNEWIHEVRILVVERYESAGGDPADTTIRTWLDTRVDFVESTVIDTIDYDGRTKLSIGSTRQFLTESIEVETYSVEFLNQDTVFWSAITATFHEYEVG